MAFLSYPLGKLEHMFGTTAMLDPACSHHHDLKSYKGWAFVEGTGKRPLVPPDDPRHPKNAREGWTSPGSSDVA